MTDLMPADVISLTTSDWCRPECPGSTMLMDEILEAASRGAGCEKIRENVAIAAIQKTPVGAVQIRVPRNTTNITSIVHQHRQRDRVVPTPWAPCPTCCRAASSILNKNLLLSSFEGHLIPCHAAAILPKRFLNRIRFISLGHPPS